MAGAGAVRQAMIARTRGLPPGWWLIVLAATTLTNLLDFLAVPAPGTRPGLGFAAAAVVRIAAVFYVAYAVARVMAGVARAARIERAMLRYLAVAVGLAVGFGLMVALVGAVIPLKGRPLAQEWLIHFAIQAVWAIALVRLVGLQNGYAAGARWRDFGALIAGTRGAGVALAVALAQLILPFTALHGALTMIAVRVPLTGPAQAALALVDGAVSAVQLVLLLALGDMARARAGLRGPGLQGGPAGR